MLSSLLGNFLNDANVTSQRPVNRGNVDFLKRRKLIIQKFLKFDPNDNIARARIAKELISVSRTEGERKAALKFYRDETAIHRLKQKIKNTISVNEKLSLARKARRLAAKKQKEYWDRLITKLQKLKQEKTIKVKTEKKTLVKRQDESKEENIVKEEDLDEEIDEEVDGDEEDYEEDETEEDYTENEDNESVENQSDDLEIESDEKSSDEKDEEGQEGKETSNVENVETANDDNDNDDEFENIDDDLDLTGSEDGDKSKNST